MVLNYPTLPSIYFKNKINRLENKNNSFQNNRILIKNKINYAYGIILENNDKIIHEDYKKAVIKYKEAYKIFLEVKQLCINNLIYSNSKFDEWFDGKENINFKENDIFELYYLSASLGGAIKSSRGNPMDLIYLPKIGKLLKKAITINPKWNGGSLQSAMMSYTSSRMDLNQDIIKDSVNYYFKNTLEFSDSLDASVFVSYAEIIYKPEQKKIDFKNTLDYVLSIKTPKNSEFGLQNIIAKKRAKWLLSNMDDYFIE